MDLGWGYIAGDRSIGICLDLALYANRIARQHSPTNLRLCTPRRDGEFGLWCMAMAAFSKIRPLVSGNGYAGCRRSLEGVDPYHVRSLDQGKLHFHTAYEEEHYSSASRSTETEIIWKATCEADYRSVRSSAGIPFEFAPPGNALKKTSAGGIWWLKISAPMRGVNFMTLFNVTFLLDALPKDKNMPWWGQMLTDLTR